MDLVGPDKGFALETERLAQTPSRWYLTGFLVPLEASEEQRAEETAGDQVDELSASGGLDDSATPEPAVARRAFFPSSMGLSFLVRRDTKQLLVSVRWGDYRLELEAAGGKEDGDAKQEAHSPATPSDGERGLFRARWQRTQREEQMSLSLPVHTPQPAEYDVPGSGGLKLVLSVRPVPSSRVTEGLVPRGARSVSVFLVNRRPPATDEVRDERFAFQAELTVESDTALVPRPNVRGLESDDWDERVGDLQYRDAFEYAVGHGVATRAVLDSEGSAAWFTAAGFPMPRSSVWPRPRSRA